MSSIEQLDNAKEMEKTEFGAVRKETEDEGGIQYKKKKKNRAQCALF